MNDEYAYFDLMAAFQPKNKQALKEILSDMKANPLPDIDKMIREAINEDDELYSKLEAMGGMERERDFQIATEASKRQQILHQYTFIVDNYTPKELRDIMKKYLASRTTSNDEFEKFMRKQSEKSCRRRKRKFDKGKRNES